VAELYWHAQCGVDADWGRFPSVKNEGRKENWALAPEVRPSTQGGALKPVPFRERLKPCPSFITQSGNTLSFRRQPINRGNSILFGLTLSSKQSTSYIVKSKLTAKLARFRGEIARFRAFHSFFTESKRPPSASIPTCISIKSCYSETRGTNAGRLAMVLKTYRAYRAHLSRAGRL